MGNENKNVFARSEATKQARIRSTGLTALHSLSVRSGSVISGGFCEVWCKIAIFAAQERIIA